MSEYPYLVYTDKWNAKIDAETIDSMSGGSGGSGNDYYIVYTGSSQIVDTNVEYINADKIDKIRMSKNDENTFVYLSGYGKSIDEHTVYAYYPIREGLFYVTLQPSGVRIVTS